MAHGNRKTGLPSIRKHARSMCKFIFLFTPVIKFLYSDSPNLITALEAANVACDALVAEIDLVTEQGT